MSDSEMRLIMQRIRNRRKELGMSYQDLSDKTNISKSSLQRYETGYIKNMPLDKLEIMASALKCSPSYLMGWTDNPINEAWLLGQDVEIERKDNLKALSDKEFKLLNTFNCLNDTGKTEAQKRVEELTMIDKYKKNMLCAAARNGNLRELPDSELIDDDIKNADDPDFL